MIVSREKLPFTGRMNPSSLNVLNTLTTYQYALHYFPPFFKHAATPFLLYIRKDTKNTPFFALV